MHCFSRKCIQKCRLRNGVNLVSALMYFDGDTAVYHWLPYRYPSPGGCTAALTPGIHSRLSQWSHFLMSPRALLTHWLLGPVWYGNGFKKIMYRHIIQNGNLGTHHKIACRRMPQHLTNQKSTLVQAMVWCRFEISHETLNYTPQNMRFTDVHLCVWFRISLNCDAIHPSARNYVIIGSVNG